MPKITFDIAFDRLLGHEGGYSNDPRDPGGETNWGISKRSYPTVDIKNLTRDGAKAIYKKDFWNTINADSLPSSVSFQLFDFAVNSGIQTAIREFQRSIGVAADGHWGPMSQGKAESIGENDLIMGLIAARMDFQSDLKGWLTYGRGWTKRNANNLRYARNDNSEEKPWIP